MSRHSRWARIYADLMHTDDGAPFLGNYVRLTPDFMELEATGFGHGISIGATASADKASVHEVAERISAFMEVLVAPMESRRLAGEGPRTTGWAEVVSHTEDGIEAYRVWLAPADAAIRRTSFPEGLWMGSAQFEDHAEALEFAHAVDRFMAQMELDWRGSEVWEAIEAGE